MDVFLFKLLSCGLSILRNMAVATGERLLLPQPCFSHQLRFYHLDKSDYWSAEVQHSEEAGSTLLSAFRTQITTTALPFALLYVAMSSW